MPNSNPAGPIASRPRSLASYQACSRASLARGATLICRGPTLDRPPVFIHRDLHPGNVLWHRGNVAHDR
ncbi:MAG: phosphotransferase [Acidimicrobiales bacterium]